MRRKREREMRERKREGSERKSCERGERKITKSKTGGGKSRKRTREKRKEMRERMRERERERGVEGNYIKGENEK